MSDDRESTGSTGAAAATPEAGARWRAFPDNLRLRVLPAGAGTSGSSDLAEPFSPLAERGRFSRVLAAAIVGPKGEVVRDLALKLQSDEYPATNLPDWTNEDVDRQWATQYERVCRAAAAGAAPAVIDVFPPAGDGGAAEFPAMLYCKKTREFFAAPCPLCGCGLRVCRDSALLEASGLPRYDRSLARFLYCQACRERPEHRFYTLLLDDPALRSTAPVGEQADLYAALGDLAREGGPLPCHGCEHQPTCHPSGAEGDAVRYLTPLSFYDFRCYATERFDLHYSELIRFVGGAAVPDVGGSPAAALTARRRFLFQGDPRGRLPLEVLRVKIAVFSQAVAAVRQLHASTGLPHLAVSAENLMVRLSETGRSLPSLYGIETRLLGVGTLRERIFEGLDATRLEVPSLVPPPVREASWASSLFVRAGGAHEGELRIQSVRDDPTDGRMSIEAELSAESYAFDEVSPKDVIHVKVRQARPVPLSFEFIGHPLGRGDDRVRLRSVSVQAAASQKRSLMDLGDQTTIRATFLAYPCLHVPCDIESLGLLLFTTLVANSARGPAAISRAARGLCDRVFAFAEEHPEAEADALAEIAAEAVARAQEEGWLSPRNLYDNPETFPIEAEGNLSPHWRAALVLGLRALTRTPGFGFCRAHDDFETAHPEGPADHFLAELEILQEAIDDELLQMQGRRREMAEAVRRMRGRVRPGAAPRRSGAR